MPEQDPSPTAMVWRSGPDGRHPQGMLIPVGKLPRILGKVRTLRQIFPQILSGFLNSLEHISLPRCIFLKLPPAVRPDVYKKSRAVSRSGARQLGGTTLIHRPCRRSFAACNAGHTSRFCRFAPAAFHGKLPGRFTRAVRLGLSASGPFSVSVDCGYYSCSSLSYRYFMRFMPVCQDDTFSHSAS